MKPVHFKLSLLSVLVVIIACKSETPTKSRVKLDDGEYITKDSVNTADGTFRSFTHIKGESSGGACTGTAVSTTTVITAGHCVMHVHQDGVDQNGRPIDTRPTDNYDKNTGLVTNKEFCVTNKLYNRVCSDKLYVNLGYPAAAHVSGTADSAYVVFPEGTFQTYHAFNTDGFTVGDRVLLVGYSTGDLSEAEQAKYPNGVKRFGYSKIAKFSHEEQDDIITNHTKSFEGVGLSPGDSGGPMMKDCKVIGVASRSALDLNPKFGIHTNLAHNSEIQFLKNPKDPGAYFCGITGNDPKFCPQDKLAKTNPNAGEKEFPCLMGVNSNPTPDQNQNNTAGGAFAMLNESNQLQVRGVNPLKAVDVCVGMTQDAAKGCASKLPATVSGQDFKTASINLDGSTEWFMQVVGTEASGKAVSAMIKLKRKQ